MVPMGKEMDEAGEEKLVDLLVWEGNVSVVLRVGEGSRKKALLLWLEWLLALPLLTVYPLL